MALPNGYKVEDGNGKGVTLYQHNKHHIFEIAFIPPDINDKNYRVYTNYPNVKRVFKTKDKARAYVLNYMRTHPSKDFKKSVQKR